MTTAPSADTRIGAVHLTVRDLPRARDFYERVLGMRAEPLGDGSVAVSGALEAPGRPLLVLHPDPDAAPAARRRPGLFHFALLVPSRRELAVALLRLVRKRWPLDGASDHLVSEALYLSDPEGNGIEIYRDRPREEWPRDGSGTLQMATLPLDLDSLALEVGTGDPLAAAFGGPGGDPGLAPGTTVGHIHLQVAELAEIERFYTDLLGLDVTVRGYPGALFVSAGGYHHHIGLNTWHSRGGLPVEPGTAGLRFYELRLGRDGLTEARGRLDAAGVPLEDAGDGFLVRDPSGNAALLAA